MKKRYQRRRQEAIQQLGGKCVWCHSTENLEFDHSFSEKRWQEELSKCQLLCEPCHKDKHKSQAECGTAHRYWRGCRCEACTAANTRHSSEYRKRRRLRSTTEEIL